MPLPPVAAGSVTGVIARLRISQRPPTDVPCGNAGVASGPTVNSNVKMSCWVVLGSSASSQPCLV